MHEIHVEYRELAWLTSFTIIKPVFRSLLYRYNRELSVNVKRRLEVNDMAGISWHKSYKSAVVEVEGMDFDEESWLKNIFWTDNRNRQAYKEFEDVITFDTTYITNKYDMPFAAFVGVNHHGQSTLLGCGLVSNENTETFVVASGQECRITQRSGSLNAFFDRYMITVLLRNNVTSLPDTYILQRWRRDVNRAYTGVVVNYNGLNSSPAQLRYDKMCQSFASPANMIADDEESHALMEWIEREKQTLKMMKSISGSNNTSQQAFHTM
ncbi:uncharacterized protein LOC111390397 [Olea europaea var. sylvestris]|uniref:uncharacterized protein LOC111390397 n=1 Tax=Olea europaea var. sylvestris TaxID=158386 RepID=UPI000C1CF570|nr:uncharacterized protein LOC111390397 [Olea europaea var. sylvestris]